MAFFRGISLILGRFFDHFLPLWYISVQFGAVWVQFEALILAKTAFSGQKRRKGEISVKIFVKLGSIGSVEKL